MENCNNAPKVPFDPGWNDPPPLLYNAQQSIGARPRNFLNKRVAFPLSGGTPSPCIPGSVPPTNLPPIPSALPVPLPVFKQFEIFTKSNENDVDSKYTLVEVKGILLEFLEGSSELGAKANDIKRRISVMEEMWSSEKLNKNIHCQMKKLAYALRDDQPSKADEIHRALMVDHVSIVGNWMPGIKQLIHHCIARSELLAIDKE